MMNSICLVTAVDVEFKTAIGLLTQTTLATESKFKICRGYVGDRQITVLQCGMGARGFAEWLQQHLATNRYDALIVVGLAGGLDPRLKTGDAVIYDSCLSVRSEVGQVQNLSHQIKKSQAPVNSYNLCATSAELCASAVKKFSDAHFSSVHCGAGITTDQIVTDAADKLRLGEQHQALAVDMESFDVLQVAAELNLPAMVIRVISDEASHDLPDFNYAAEADGAINHRRMAVAMLRRPVASVRFLRSLNTVVEALRKSLEVVLRL
ncbi:MAG: hypothetical protein ACKVZH_28970 [Blastocatellia bacterium]